MTKRQRIEQLLRESHLALLKVAFKLTRDKQSAEDLVQTTSAKALEKAETCKRFTVGWLTTILWYQFLDDIAAADRRLPHDDIDAIELPAAERSLLELWRLVNDEQLERAVRALPDEFREAWVLFEVDGLSQEQIARRLKIKPATVATRVKRARERLKVSLLQLLAME